MVGFASIRDVYSGDQCAKIISRISMVAAVSPEHMKIKLIVVLICVLGCMNVVYQ